MHAKNALIIQRSFYFQYFQIAKSFVQNIMRLYDPIKILPTKSADMSDEQSPCCSIPKEICLHKFQHECFCYEKELFICPPCMIDLAVPQLMITYLSD